MENNIDKNRLVTIALKSYEKFKNSDDKVEALRIVFDVVTHEMGNILGTYFLYKLDDVAIGFIELLDQIIFEIDSEHNKSVDPIDEYIIDDLYQRAESYLDLFKDVEIYKKNLRERLINFDDSLIIRNYKLKEFIPSLQSEFYEQPNMRLAILKTLLYFDNDELLQFFYDIAKNGYDIELRILALIGLKKYKYRFDNWHSLANSGNQDFNSLVNYVKSFSYIDCFDDKDHNNAYILLFKILFIEVSITNGIDLPEKSRLLRFLYTTSSRNVDNPSLQIKIFNSIANIITKFDFNILKSILKDGDNLTSFLYLVDTLPYEVFNRVMVIIDHLGDDFLYTVEKLISAGKLKLREKGSKLLGYFFSVGHDIIKVK